MNPTPLARRRGLALPIVLAVIVVLSILVAGLFLFGHGGLRQTGAVVADVEHLYRAEGIFHRVVSRLKRSGWNDRYYAPPGERTRCCNAAEQGVYREASYELWVQDVADTNGRPVPGLVDLLIRVVHRDTARNFVTRLRLVDAAAGSRRVETAQFTRTTESIDGAEGRLRAVETLDRNERQREANRAESETLARVLQEGSRPGETTSILLTRLRADGSLSARTQRREEALEVMRKAIRALGRAGIPLVELVGRADGFGLRGMDRAPDPVRARTLLEALMARLEAKTDGEGKELFRLAAYLDMRCRRLEIETMSILAPERKKRVEELLALAERLADGERRQRREESDGENGEGVEEWALGPYVLLELARAKAQGFLHGIGSREDVASTLAELAETWPDHRLFGDDLSLDRIWEDDRNGLEGLVVARAVVPAAVFRAVPALTQEIVDVGEGRGGPGSEGGVEGNGSSDSTGSVDVPTADDGGASPSQDFMPVAANVGEAVVDFGSQAIDLLQQSVEGNANDLAQGLQKLMDEHGQTPSISDEVSSDSPSGLIDGTQGPNQGRPPNDISGMTDSAKPQPETVDDNGNAIPTGPPATSSGGASPTQFQ